MSQTDQTNQTKRGTPIEERPDLQGVANFWADQDANGGRGVHLKDFTVTSKDRESVKPSTIEDVRALTRQTQVIEFGHPESEMTFAIEIRSIPIVRVLIESHTPLMIRLMKGDDPSGVPLVDLEQAKLDRATPEEQRQYSLDKLAQRERIIVEGVVAPPLTLDPNEESKIHISDLPEAIRDSLFEQIFRFSVPEVAERLLSEFQEDSEDARRQNDVSAMVQESENLRQDTV